MQKESIVVVIPLPNRTLSPNFTIGGIGGRMMVNASRKKLRKLVYDAVQAEEVATAPWGRCGVGAVFYHAVKRIRDEDNATGSLKAAYDGIVDAGLVKGDDHEHMTREKPRFLIDKIYPRVILEITNLTGEGNV